MITSFSDSISIKLIANSRAKVVWGIWRMAKSCSLKNGWSWRANPECRRWVEKVIPTCYLLTCNLHLNTKQLYYILRNWFYYITDTAFTIITFNNIWHLITMLNSPSSHFRIIIAYFFLWRISTNSLQWVLSIHHHSSRYNANGKYCVPINRNTKNPKT